jgi:hypothetical protein
MCSAPFTLGMHESGSRRYSALSSRSGCRAAQRLPCAEPHAAGSLVTSDPP